MVFFLESRWDSEKNGERNGQEKDKHLVFWEDDEEAMPEIAVVLTVTASCPLADSSVFHDAVQKVAP